MVLSGHQGHVFASRFNPSGTVLASASADMKICKIFQKHFLLLNHNLVFWRLVNDCENFLVLKGHQGTILDIAWSADGQYEQTMG